MVTAKWQPYRSLFQPSASLHGKHFCCHDNTGGGRGLHETCSTRPTYCVGSNWPIKPLEICWWKFESAPCGLMANWLSWRRVNSIANRQAGSFCSVLSLPGEKRGNRGSKPERKSDQWGTEGKKEERVLRERGKQSWLVHIRKALSVRSPLAVILLVVMLN